MGVDREGRLDGDRQTGRLKEGRPEEGRLGRHTEDRLGGTERERER